MAEENVYLNLGVDYDLRMHGAQEVARGLGEVNKQYSALKKTESEAKDYNANLLSKSDVSMMGRVLGSVSNISDALSHGTAHMKDMSVFGQKFATDLYSVSTVFSGNKLVDVSKASFGELGKMHEKLAAEVAKFREAVQVNITSHQLYTQQQLRNLEKEEDIVAQKTEKLKEAFAMLDKQAAKYGAVSRDVYKSWQKDLSATSNRLREIGDERQLLNDKIAGTPKTQANQQIIQDMVDRIAELDKEYVSLNAHAEVLAKNTEKYKKLLEDSGLLQQVETLEKNMADAEKAQARINRERERVLNASPADTQKSFARNFTQYEIARKKLEQVEAAMTRAGQRAEYFRNAVTKALKSGWQHATKTANSFKIIYNFLTKISSAVRSWRKEQTSVADQAKKLYSHFTGLFRMLKTRIKRRLVALMFEDVVGTLREIATISPRFNTALSGFVVSAKTLGVQILAAFEPLASVVLPILSQFLDYLTVGAAKMAQFISKATGNLTFLKASKGQYDYAASLDKTTASTKKATKATKDYQNTVMGFDQLHKLNGGNDDFINGVDIDNALDEASALNTLGERLWDALNRHDFRAAGQVLGEAFNMGFGWLKDNFGFKENGKKFTDWLESSITLVNGFIDSLDPISNGEAIADVNNNLIHLIDTLVNPDSEVSLHFREAGEKLGQQLTTSILRMDWKTFGSNLTNSLQSGVSFITGLLESEVAVLKHGDAFELKEVYTDENGLKRFKSDIEGQVGEIVDESKYELTKGSVALGRGLAKMFEGAIDSFTPETWSELISSLVTNFFRFIGAAFGNPQKASEFGQKIGQAINDGIKGINAQDVAEGINNFAESFSGFMESLFGELSLVDAFNKLNEVLGGLNWGSVGKMIGWALAPSIFTGILSYLGSLGQSVVSAAIAKVLGWGSGVGVAGLGAIPTIGLAILAAVIGGFAGIMLSPIFQKGADWVGRILTKETIEENGLYGTYLKDPMLFVQSLQEADPEYYANHSKYISELMNRSNLNTAADKREWAEFVADYMLEHNYRMTGADIGSAHKYGGRINGKWFDVEQYQADWDWNYLRQREEWWDEYSKNPTSALSKNPTTTASTVASSSSVGSFITDLLNQRGIGDTVIGQTMQTIADEYGASNDALVSYFDADGSGSFEDTLTECVSKVVVAEDGTLAAADAEQFKQGIIEGVVEGFKEALANADGDIVLNVGNDELARATILGVQKLNKQGYQTALAFSG